MIPKLLNYWTSFTVAGCRSRRWSQSRENQNCKLKTENVIGGRAVSGSQHLSRGRGLRTEPSADLQSYAPRAGDDSRSEARRSVCSIALGLIFLAMPVFAGTATINIDVGKPGPRLNPRMYG